MKTKKAWLAAMLALVFLAGGLGGAFGGYSWARKTAPRTPAPSIAQREYRPPRPPDFPDNPDNADKAKIKEKFKKMFLSRLDEELGLNEDQRQKAGVIFDTQHEQVVAMRDEMRGRFLAIEGRTLEQIGEILDPQQKDKLDALVEQYKAQGKDDKIMPLFMRPRDGYHDGKGGRGHKRSWNR